MRPNFWRPAISAKQEVVAINSKTLCARSTAHTSGHPAAIGELETRPIVDGRPLRAEFWRIPAAISGRRCRERLDYTARWPHTGRASVADGNSPKSSLYSPASLPKFQKPYRVAITVTVVCAGVLSRNTFRNK